MVIVQSAIVKQAISELPQLIAAARARQGQRTTEEIAKEVLNNREKNQTLGDIAAAAREKAGASSEGGD